MSAKQSQKLREYLRGDPFLLAPLAGVSDASYREIAYEHGCRRAYTEMVSVAGMLYDSDRTWTLVQPGKEEPGIAVQIFGSRPEQFAPAVNMLTERLGSSLLLVDINMACPVPKVFKKGEGSALMLDPARAAAIVKEAKSALEGTEIPLTCKIRSGVKMTEELAPGFARMLEEAGADGIAVHGRSTAQLYRGRADWGVIERVVASVDLPVIGSGDVECAEDAVSMLSMCKCDGVFIARGSFGNPWIFDAARELLKNGTKPMTPTFTERLNVLEHHIDKAYGYHLHMARLRPLVGWYIKGLPAATVWRAEAMRCSTYEDYKALIQNMRQACREHGLE
ncbi:MAG: tRNA-dihydrouridine synthase [Coriobacteriales bacterium]|nr:tRNA-dihydrouridine synthase [Coriobacteriales bacterium]